MSDNPFALSNIQPAGGEREPDSNPFSLSAIARDQGRDQRVELQRAVRVNPDQAAEVERLAQRYPAPKDVLLRNLQDVQLQAAVDKADETLRTSPKLAQYMRDNPWVAKQSHDDLGTLAQIEQFFVDTGGSMKAGVYNASKGAAGTFRAGAELLAPTLDFLEPVTEVGGNPLRRLAEGFDMLAQQNDASAKAAAPTTTGNLSAGFQSGVQSLTQNLLALPMAFAPGGQGAALGMMTASTGGQSYQDARDKGLPMAQALPFAASQAAIEYATEKMPLGQLLGDVKAGTAFYKMIAKQIALEVPGEQVATVLQDLNEWAVLNPEKPFSSYLEERPNAAAQTLVATIVGAGGNVAVVKGIEAALSRGAKGAQQVDEAERSNAALQAAMQTAAASKLRERNPETFKQLIQQMADETDGAPSSVFIDAQVLAQSGVNVAEVFPSVAEQMDAALATNGSVEVPIGDVLAAAPGTPLEQLFLQNARATADGLSIAEAKQASDQAGEFLKSEADRVLADAQDQQAWQQSADTVKATLLEQLNTAGRFTADVNDAYSTLVRDFYSVMASRQGVTPEELYAKYPLRVAAGGQSAARLDQGQVAEWADRETAPVGSWVKADFKLADSQPVYQVQDIALDNLYLPELDDNGNLQPEKRKYLADYTERAQAGEVAPGISVIEMDDGRLRVVDGHRRAMAARAAGKTSIRALVSPLIDTPNGKQEATVENIGQALNQATPQPLPATINVDGKERPTTNSKGQQIAATVEGVENFWRWFGDSKVVDDQGRPLVVYHGSGNDFAEFNTQGGTGKTSDTGAFFTESAPVANSYASGESRNVMPVYLNLSTPVVIDAKGKNWNRIQQSAKVQLPAVEVAAKTDQGDEDLLAELEGRAPEKVKPTKRKAKNTNVRQLFAGEWGYPDDTAATDDIARWARTNGYEGVVVNNVVDRGPSGAFDADAALSPSTIYAVFSPTQIKSATGNRGAFDPQDANILNQQARGTFSPDQLLITLNENADLSTFLHESGHFFLEMMADMASQPNAPADVQDDMNRLLKWFGIKGDEQVGGADMVQAIRSVLPTRVFSPEEVQAIGDAAFSDRNIGGAAKAAKQAIASLVDVSPAQMSDVMTAIRAEQAGRTPLEVWNAMTLDQKRPHHERFAESFEQYLLEGKAPNAELQPLFRRFRAWMVNVYKSLTQFMRGRDLKLSDEVRQVFDRMLATDEQIAQAEQSAGLLPDFDATNEAIEKLQARSLRDLKWTVNARSRALKALTKEAKLLRKGVENEVRAEVEAMPEVKAQDALKKIKKPTDMDLALVADQTGYATVEEMLQAIDQFGDKNAAVEGMTDQRMLENFGELATPEAIEEAANDAVHNEARARSLATELKAQADALNPREQTGTASNGRAITVNALTKAAKEFAQNLAARRRVKDLKAATTQHRATEARAAKMWQDATAKGKTQEAVQAKRDQMLNHFTVRAMQDAQAEAKKIVEFFRKVTKDGNEKLVDKGRDPDVVNAMRAILAAYDVAPRLEKGALEYMDTVARNDPAMYAALQPSVQGALMNAKPLGEMTVEELRGLHDEMRAMWHLAKRSRQMEVDGNLLDIEDAADELMTRMEAVGIPLTVPGESGAITVGEEAGIKLQFAKAILSRVEQWAERMDGKFGGPFLRLVFQPIKDAADRYRTDKTTYRKEFTKLVEAVAPSLKPGIIDAPELGYKFGQGKDGGTAELLHAILHTGNESNKRKLLLGRGWATENEDGAMDTSRWDAFMQRMHDTGVVTKAHYDFAQGVWDLLERMKPLAQETHRKVFGRYFAEVTANTLDTPFGPYRGGYVPAQTDSRLVKDAKLRELAEGENESLAYAFPSSPSGFTKARVEYNKPLLLDLRALAQHMDKVLLFSHMQGAVTDVRRLLTNKRVSYALDRIQPGAYEGMLTPWLNRSAKQIVETPVMGDRGISRFLSAARSRAGMALMFANLSNTVQQITGFSTAAVKVKPGLMVKALASFTASPKAMRESVVNASEFMRNRMQNEVAALNNVVEEILIEPNLLERGQAWTQKHAYFMQSAVDNTMAPIIWTAAYNQATEQKMDHKEAVRFADGVVRQTQGTTLPEDVSRFETGPAYARLFTQFVSYFNMMANTNATAMKQIADDMGLRKGAGKLVYVALAGLLAPIWVAEAIAQAFKGGPDDEDRDGWLDDWLMAVFGVGTLKGLTAMVPIVGQSAQLAVNRFNDNPADDKFSLSPAVSLIESAVSAPASVYGAIVDDGKVQKAVRDVAAAATLATGLPFYALARPAGYASGVAAGQIDPTSEVDAVRGLLTGNASAESKN